MKDVFVGVLRPFAHIAAALAAGAIASGDTVHVDKGTYTNVPAWYRNVTDLTIVCDSATVTYDDKGEPNGLQNHAVYECTPVVNANNVAVTRLAGNGGIFAFGLNTRRITVKGIEFRGARSSDYNGAGIRFQGVGLIHENCWFHDNDMGVLSGAQLTADGKLDGHVVGICSIAHDNGAAGVEPGHNYYYGPCKYQINTEGSSHDARAGGHNEKFHQAGGLAISYRMAHPNSPLSAASSDIDANTGDTLIAGFSGVKPVRPVDAAGKSLPGYDNTNYFRQISVDTNRDDHVAMNHFAMVGSVLQSAMQNAGSAVRVKNNDSKIDADALPEPIEGLIEDCVFLLQPAVNGATGVETPYSWHAHPIDAAAGVTIGGSNQFLTIGDAYTMAPQIILPADFHLTLETLPAFLAAVTARYPHGPDWTARYAALEAGVMTAGNVPAVLLPPAPVPPAPAPVPAPVASNPADLQTIKDLTAQLAVANGTISDQTETIVELGGELAAAIEERDAKSKEDAATIAHLRDTLAKASGDAATLNADLAQA